MLPAIMCRRANLATFSLTPLLLFAVAVVGAAEQSSFKIILETEDFKNRFNLLSPTNFLENFERDNDAFDDANNKTCSRDLGILQKALKNKELWALQMFDASSKIPSGWLKGNMLDLGMYDECLGAKGESEGIAISGRHCMYTIYISLIGKESFSISPSLSICVPVTCNGKDVIDLFKSFPSANNSQLPGLRFEVVSATCSSVNQELWSTEFIICSIVLATFTLFLIACTAYDLNNSRSSSNASQRSNYEFLTKFSLVKSVAAILNTEVKEGNLPVIHGIRYLAICAIVLGHEYGMQMIVANVNTFDALQWFSSWRSLYVFMTPFGVDTFFTLSGFLMTYIFCKQMPKRKNFNVFAYYLHRYLRLTPSVIVVLIMAIVFVPKISSGPQWDKANDYFVSSCRTEWWHHLLYVQNFVGNGMCLEHLWYLAVDMQLFLISPLILYPLYKRPKVGLSIVALLFLISMGLQAAFVVIYEYRSITNIRENTKPSEHANVFNSIIKTPYCRATPWLMGIVFGYDLATKKRILKRFYIVIGWLLAVAAFAFCLVGTRSLLMASYEYNVIWEALFTSLSRPLWAYFICWTIYASNYKCAGPITTFLSSNLFLPLSRISYSIYLVHTIVLLLQVGIQRTPWFFTDYFVLHHYIGDLDLSITVGFIFSLLIEIPVLTLEKIILKRDHSSSPRRKIGQKI